MDKIELPQRLYKNDNGIISSVPGALIQSTEYALCRGNEAKVHYFYYESFTTPKKQLTRQEVVNYLFGVDLIGKLVYEETLRQIKDLKEYYHALYGFTENYRRNLDSLHFHKHFNTQLIKLISEEGYDIDTDGISVKLVKR